MPDMKKIQETVKKGAAEASEKAKEAAEKAKETAEKTAEKVGETKLTVECDNCKAKVPVTLAQVRANETVTCPACGQEVKAREEALDKAKSLQGPVKQNLGKVKRLFKR